jgi:hypothetical protein
VFSDTLIDRNGPVYFRCHVDETLHHAALEIPDWMFDSTWSTASAVETPIVGWQALRNLKVLLASASNDDPMAKEAHGFEGGRDATDAESKTISIGTVPSIHPGSALENNAIGLETKNDPVAVTIVSPVLGKPTCPPEQGGRQ